MMSGWYLSLDGDWMNDSWRHTIDGDYRPKSLRTNMGGDQFLEDGTRTTQEELDKFRNSDHG